jgi:ABC-type antimicrobial peptide transport system permease subunit
MGSLTEGAKSFDFEAYTLAAISICLVATASIWLATRRIARMDIADILRAE